MPGRLQQYFTGRLGSMPYDVLMLICDQVVLNDVDNQMTPAEANEVFDASVFEGLEDHELDVRLNNKFSGTCTVGECGHSTCLEFENPDSILPGESPWLFDEDWHRIGEQRSDGDASYVYDSLALMQACQFFGYNMKQRFFNSMQFALWIPPMPYFRSSGWRRHNSPIRSFDRPDYYYPTDQVFEGAAKDVRFLDDASRHDHPMVFSMIKNLGWKPFLDKKAISRVKNLHILGSRTSSYWMFLGFFAHADHVERYKLETSPNAIRPKSQRNYCPRLLGEFRSVEKVDLHFNSALGPWLWYSQVFQVNEWLCVVQNCRTNEVKWTSALRRLVRLLPTLQEMAIGRSSLLLHPEYGVDSLDGDLRVRCMQVCCPGADGRKAVPRPGCCVEEAHLHDPSKEHIRSVIYGVDDHLNQYVHGLLAERNQARARLQARARERARERSQVRREQDRQRELARRRRN